MLENRPTSAAPAPDAAADVPVETGAAEANRAEAIDMVGGGFQGRRRRRLLRPRFGPPERKARATEIRSIKQGEGLTAVRRLDRRRRLLPRYRHFLPRLPRSSIGGAALAVRCDFQLARRLPRLVDHDGWPIHEPFEKTTL
ncbi:hypothetical protein [Brevundimonas sp.]|uniref:hypothetical protein n=1 Tax=Brevundimonas sp. TaxID=1871086 RepID=UPI003B00EAB4